MSKTELIVNGGGKYTVDAKREVNDVSKVEDLMLIITTEDTSVEVKFTFDTVEGLTQFINATTRAAVGCAVKEGK